MAQVNAGRVRFIGRGEYDNSTQYYTFDLVDYNGNSYFAKANTTGNVPTNTTYWQLVAEKGNTGNTGPTGPTGNGIASIAKTASAGLIDTYTITFTDGTTSTFNITNGQDGEVTQEVFDEEIDRLSMVYNALPSDEETGESITIDGTAEVPFRKIDLKGNTYQNGEPTPTSPIDIQVVSGDNTIKVEGKNLFDKNNFLLFNGYVGNATPYALSSSTESKTLCFPVEPNETYTISKIRSTYFRLAYIKEEPANGVAIYDWNNGTNYDYKTITVSSDAKYLVCTYWASTDTLTEQQILDSIQIEKGNQPTTYTPYVSQTHPIYLGVNIKTPFRQGSGGNASDSKRLFCDDNYYMEQGKAYTISTNLDTTTYKYAIAINDTRFPAGSPYEYDSGWQTTETFTFTATASGYLGIGMSRQDNGNIVPSDISGTTFGIVRGETYFTPIELCKIGDYQDRIYKQDNKWYIEKQIGKVVLDGSETLEFDSNNLIYKEDNIKNYNAGGLVYCNYYLGTANGGSANVNLNAWNGNAHNINIKNNSIANLNDFKTWLGTHNTIVYYVLATPTTTEITDNTLIGQLNALEGANSYDNQTNVSQVNNDMPFIITAEAILSLKNILNI